MYSFFPRRLDPPKALSAALSLLWLLATVPPLLAAAGPAAGAPAPAAAASTTEALPTRLPPVTVLGLPEDPATGKSTLEREAIERLPAGNGSINELLRVLPGVQLSETAFRSERGGEILPPELSLAGGKIFQNTLLVDGISVDSRLDPVADDPRALNDLPGQGQEILLNSRLVEKVTLFDHNVPARYGDFTGGVVDIEMRDPRPEFGGAVRLRTTRDTWTHFHVTDEKEEDFRNSGSHLLQPKFDKYDGGVELDLPLRSGTGLLTSYQIVTSRIPLTFLGGDRTQSRRLENYYAKLVQALPAAGTLELSFLSTPYKGEYFSEHARDSDYTISKSGQTVVAGYRGALAIGDLELRAAYSRSENSRQAPSHWRNWKITPAKPWGALAGLKNSREGGFGDLEKDQESWQLKGHLDLAPLDAGPFSHLMNAGFDVQRIRGRFEREETTFSFNTATLSTAVICGEDGFACVDGEQFFTVRSVYEADSASARIDLLSLYLEDRIAIGNFEFRPGLRLSHDDFLGNTDLAPRLAASWDLFGDGRTVLVGGANRYYGQALLTDKLREAQRPFRIERRKLGADSRPTDWALSLQTNLATRHADLDTPYADELTVGLNQALLGGLLALDYIRREGKDEFARERGTVQPDGLRYDTLNNNGRSRHESYRASWERSWRRHYLALNVAYQETTSSTEDYDTLLDEEQLAEPVWYDGELLTRDELPRTDFNRAWVGNLVYSCRLPYGFEFTNVTRYRSGYRALADSFDNMTLPDGKTVDIYEEVKNPESWVFDWEFVWRRNLPWSQQLALSLEIYNVFNRKLRSSDNGDHFFEPGRQFWAGAEYRF